MIFQKKKCYSDNFCFENLKKKNLIRKKKNSLNKNPSQKSINSRYQSKIHKFNRIKKENTLKNFIWNSVKYNEIVIRCMFVIALDCTIFGNANINTDTNFRSMQRRAMQSKIGKLTFLHFFQIKFSVFDFRLARYKFYLR